MKRIEKELPIIKKISKLTFVILFAFLIFFLGIAFYILRPIQIEEYCNSKAKVITGNNSTILVEPNEEELKNYPYLMSKGDKITRYYREFLNCRFHQKPFYLF